MNIIDSTLKFHTFSVPKIVSALLLIILGIFNYFWLADAEIFYFLILFNYNMISGTVIILLGVCLLIYQFFTGATIQIEMKSATLRVEERKWYSKHPHEYSFPVDQIAELKFENESTNTEFLLFYVFAFFLWFFFREGLITLHTGLILGYPLQFKIGIALILTYGLVQCLYLLNVGPFGRKRLYIANTDSYLDLAIPAIAKTHEQALISLLFPSIKSEPNPSSIYRRYGLLLFGGILIILSIVFYLLDVWVYFRVGLFTPLFLTILGFQYIVYALNHQYTSLTSSQTDLNLAGKDIKMIHQQSLKSGILCRKYRMLNPQFVKKFSPNYIDQVHFKPIYPMEAIFWLLIIGNLLSIICQRLNPIIQASENNLYFPLVFYIILLIVFILLIIGVWFYPIIKNPIFLPRLTRSYEILSRTLFLIGLCLIPIILIFVGMPILL